MTQVGERRQPHQAGTEADGKLKSQGGKHLLSRAILRAKERAEIPLIADIKPISPRDGDLMKQRNPRELARALERAGACALSVVTEPKYFGGQLRMLAEVAQAVSVPVLRKDFISSAEQIEESAAAGAAAVLLILATIPDVLLPDLYQRTIELDLEAVLEIHTRQELEQALALSPPPTIIGINNRDIRNLEKDCGTVRLTEKLAPLIPDSVVTISESSLRTPEDMRRALDAGADAVLVGTAILQSDDPAGHLADLLSRIRGAGR
ncbi:MAG: indole-3-glycerol-phosphate synthase [bacterium]|nr:indole-3-glycerol-phosphate synthase [bacterium]